MDPGQAVFTIIALTGTGIISYGGILAIQLVAKHYSTKQAGAAPGELEAELREIRARLDESDAARDRIAELEERLDFAERMLAQQREQAKLQPGGDR